MDNIFLAIVVCLVVWLMMRQARIKRAKQQKARELAAQDGPPPEPKSMPRIGEPMTITRAQIAELKKLDFTPDRGWSEEEAALIIDSVAYLRAAIEDATGERDAPLEIQNNILAFILTDEALREYLLSWGRNRSRRGNGSEKLVLRKNEHYERIVQHIHNLHDDD